MRITEIGCELYRIPAPIVLQDAIQTISHWEWIVVTVETDAGTTGTGFSYTLGTGGSALRELIRDYLAPIVLGAEVDDYGSIWDRCWRSLHANGGAGFTTLAIAPIDIALHDIRGKHASLPLYRLLGGQVDRIPVYASGINLHMTETELLAQTRRHVELGYSTVKVKVGRAELDEDVERVRQVRALIGPDKGLLLDANQSWGPEEAIRRAESLKQFNPIWLEEPCLADDIESTQRVRSEIRIPIALGETLFNRYEFAHHIRLRAVDILQPDVTRVGGFTEWLKIAALANANDLPVAPHFVMELSVHGLCAIPNGIFLENVEGGSLHELGMVAEPLRIENGLAYPPATPGHGIAFDMKSLTKWNVDRAGGDGHSGQSIGRPVDAVGPGSP